MIYINDHKVEPFEVYDPEKEEFPEEDNPVQKLSKTVQ